MKPFFSLQNVISPKQIKHLEGLGNTLQGNFHSKNYTDRGQALGLSAERDMPEDMMNEVYYMVKDEVEKAEAETFRDKLINKIKKSESKSQNAPAQAPRAAAAEEGQLLRVEG